MLECRLSDRTYGGGARSGLAGGPSGMVRLHASLAIRAIRRAADRHKTRGGHAQVWEGHRNGQMRRRIMRHWRLIIFSVIWSNSWVFL